MLSHNHERSNGPRPSCNTYEILLRDIVIRFAILLSGNIRLKRVLISSQVRNERSSSETLNNHNPSAAVTWVCKVGAILMTCCFCLLLTGVVGRSVACFWAFLVSNLMLDIF